MTDMQTESSTRYTSATPLDHFKCQKCKRYCYGNWTQHFVKVTGPGVAPWNKQGPFCDDCFNDSRFYVTVSMRSKSC